MDTSRIALLIGSIGAGLMLVLLLVPNALLSMFRPVPEAPTPAPTVIAEVPTEAPTTTPVPLPTPAPVPTEVPTTEPTAESEQAESGVVPEDTELAAYQQGLLETFNCAREEAGVAPYTLSADLTLEAYAIGDQLKADLSLEIEDVAGDVYYLKSLIAIDTEAAPDTCSRYGHDALWYLPELTEIEEIGIAVYEGSSYSVPEAIILGIRSP